MKRKTLLALIVAISCGHTLAARAHTVIGVSTEDLGNNLSQILIRNSMEKSATHRLGVRLQAEDGAWSVNMQIDGARNFIVSDMSAIMASPPDSAAAPEMNRQT